MDKPKNYFKIQQSMLKVCGISLTETKSIPYNIYSYFTIYCLIIPYVIIATADLFKHEFSVIVDTIPFVVGIWLGTVIITVTFINRLKLGRLLKKLEQEPFITNLERGGNEEEKLLNGWIWFKTKQSFILYVGVGLVYVYQVISTFINRLMSNDYHDWQFGFGTITPFNGTYSPNFEILWMYQNIVAFYLTVNGCSAILLLVAILAFISMQLRMLQNNIKRMVLNSYHRMLEETNCTDSFLKLDASKIPWKYLKLSLKSVVLYHLDIMDIAEDLEEIFTNSILFIYLCTVGMLCFEVYRISMVSISDSHTPMLLFETVAVSIHSLIICYSGQKMTDESLEIPNAVSEANYIGIDLRFQKGLIMIIRRTQRPLLIKAGKFVETSIVTYVWIVRTAYSVCMGLISAQKK